MYCPYEDLKETKEKSFRRLIWNLAAASEQAANNDPVDGYYVQGWDDAIACANAMAANDLLAILNRA